MNLGTKDISCKGDENLCSTSKELDCKICKKHFPDYFTLENHVCVLSLKSKKFFCGECQKGFTTEQILQLHAQQHNPENKYMCEICYKFFLSQANLLRHYRIVHSGNVVYQCDVCEKEFSSKSNLSQHEKCHFEGKPFSCNFCKKSFKQFSKLRVHSVCHADVILRSDMDKNIKHNDSNENAMQNLLEILPKKVFRCMVCKKIFAYKHLLKYHMTKHYLLKPFVCSICKKTFKTKGGLHVHSRFHARRKPYKCTHCNKEFFIAVDLNAHVIHNHKTTNKI